MQTQQHVNLQNCTFPDLEHLRGQLGVRQAQLVRDLEISASTYQRWLKWMRGQDGGSQPQPRNISALRSVVARYAASKPQVVEKFLGQS